MICNNNNSGLRKNIGFSTPQTTNNNTIPFPLLPGALLRINPSRIIRLVCFHCAPRRVNFSCTQPYGCISVRLVPLLLLFGILAVCSIEGNLNRYLVKSGGACTVGFEANGGVPEPMQLAVKKGSLITETAEMAKTGYAFGGWHRDAEFALEWDFENDAVKSNIVLYAKCIWCLALFFRGKQFGGI